MLSFEKKKFLPLKSQQEPWDSSNSEFRNWSSIKPILCHCLVRIDALNFTLLYNNCIIINNLKCGMHCGWG